MTDSQVKFQQVQEDIRHNRAMETYQKEQAQASKTQAETAALRAQYEGMLLPYEISLKEAQATNQNQQAKSTKTRTGFEIGSWIVSMLLPDANTALRSGAQVVSSLFG